MRLVMFGYDRFLKKPAKVRSTPPVALDCHPGRLKRGIRCVLSLPLYLGILCFWACQAPQPASPPVPELTPVELQERLIRGESPVLIDTGSYLECMDERIPGARCLGCGDFAAVAPQLQPFRERLLLFYGRGPSANRPCRALEEAREKGFLNRAMLAGGISAWKIAGYGTESPQRIPRYGIPSLQPRALDSWIQSQREFLILDIRSVEIFRQGSLTGAMNIPLSELHERYPEIPLNLPILIADADGASSMLAAGFLQWKGFGDIRRLRGGLEGWDAYRKRGIP
jgi:rhodanese-related sulfurtransferase